MIYEQLYTFDDMMRAEYPTVVGVDEAGRGPLCGPVSVAAVILDPEDRFEWLNDSKKVTEKRREVLYDEIIKRALKWECMLIDNRTIDDLNILGATMLGMKTCAEKICPEDGIILIDGNRCPETRLNCESIVKGDATSASIAAASVIAKVTRDRYMRDVIAKEFPQYGFEVHKGYPTKAHYEAIKQYGVTPYHRMSFLKNLDKK